MKFEFSDLYKFFVSLGIVSITLGVITPLLFLREPFDLFIPESELSELTPTAQIAIARRQNISLAVIRVMPWLSGAGILAGTSLTSYGLWRWYRN